MLKVSIENDTKKNANLVNFKFLVGNSAKFIERKKRMTLREFIRTISNEPYDIVYRTMLSNGAKVDYSVDLDCWIDENDNEHYLDVWDTPVSSFYFELEDGNIVLNILFGENLYD